MRPEDLPRLSVAELRARLIDRGEPLGEACEAALEADPRAGAREVLRQVRRRRQANRAEGQRLRHLLRFEVELWDRGVVHVGGVDEAGMAPLAGPVVAAACVLPHAYRPRGVDDSKQLDRAERERLAEDIRANAICWAIGRAEVEEIDRINIYRAGLLALRRAVEGLSLRPDHLLIDARKLPELGIPQTPIIHGDALSLTIAAASILAKTTRDALMSELDAVHPGYGFARHKGYPTAEHFEALGRLGACPIHRRSFAPVRQALGLEPAQGDLFAAAAAAAGELAAAGEGDEPAALELAAVTEIAGIARQAGRVPVADAVVATREAVVLEQGTGAPAPTPVRASGRSGI